MLRGLPTIRSSTRLCSLNKPRRFNVPSRFYTAAPTPEIVADYTTTKAKGSLSKKILWLTLLTGTLYTGSTYFALKNEAFHDTYITYFPGGEQLLDKLDDWAAEERTQQYYRKWIQLKEKTAEHTETARKYANTTKETAQDWYEYVSDAIAQFRGEKEPPLPPGSNPPTPVGGGNNARLRQQRLRMAAAKRDPLFTNVLYTSEKQPIPKFDLSEHDVVNQFAKTVQDLVVLLNEADMSGHAKRLVDFATRDIESLNKAFALIKQEENKAQQEIAGLHQALLASKKHLDSKQQEVEQKLQDAKARATAQVDQHIQELELKLKKETDSLNNQHKETREKELATQRQEYLQLLENELKQKAIEIQSEYASQVQQQVETERGGRLSKIDHVSQKQIELEKLVYADAELLDDVKKAHQLVAAIDALKRAALTGEQGKFVAELEALNRLSQKTPFAKVSERQNSELIQLVIKSINVHVANHGVTSLASLSDKFETVAREVRRASLIPDENASMMAHLVSIIFSSFMFKKKGLVPGDDVESRLARAEYYLNTEKDLESAAREINQLTGWPKRLSMDWLEGARRHLEVKQALDILKSEASLITKTSLRNTSQRINRRFFSNKQGFDGLVLGAYSPSATTQSTPSLALQQNISNETKKLIQTNLALSQFKKKGDLRVFYNVGGVKQVAVVSLGNEPNENSKHVKQDSVRMATAIGVQALQKQGAKSIGVDISVDAQGAAEGAILGQFSFDKLKQKKNDDADNNKVVAPYATESSTDLKRAWEIGQIYGTSQNVARMLMTTPANLMTPKLFAEEVAYLLAGLENVDIKVHDEEWATRQKMNAFLSVARGSTEPLRFLEIHYKGAKDNSEKPFGLVGKGITFDSGGISLKPSNNMHLMKGDMGGAAAVVGALYGICKLHLPVNIVAAIPLCENMPSGKATKPGDVVKAMNGKSIEILNTDAEGRLILADALHYVSSTYQPKHVIDLATLTGAMDVALGEVYAGVFSNSDDLWAKLQNAGEAVADPFWRMPLHEDYIKEMKNSLVADLGNIGTRSGGSCSAAGFLQEFVDKNVPWAHIDIAGVMACNGTKGYHIKGMTGRPTRALIEMMRTAQA